MTIMDQRTGIIWGVDPETGKESWYTPDQAAQEQSEWERRQETEEARIERERQKAFIEKQSKPRGRANNR